MKPVSQFIHETRWEHLPAVVQHQARRCLLDTLGAAVGGRQTQLSHIVHNFAAANYAGGGAVLWFDGRKVSAPGAALANGMTIDALDIHDGHKLAKGHAGAAIIPAALAAVGMPDAPAWSGEDLLAAVVVGYEIALRAALALHQTAADYHTSGAWNALGCAAIMARRLGLGVEGTRHALGIAEYQAPRSPMMRCIDHPTMIKDGSGWGAMTGVSAGLLAGAGFTGAPADLLEIRQVAEHWADLGNRWLILEQYFKPYAVCRWAQPAVVGALELQASHSIEARQIARIRIHTFHAAARLTSRRPKTTEEAQYSLPFPVAAALLYGRLGPEELSGDALQDPAVLALAESVEVVEDDDLTAAFPAERWSRVEIQTLAGAIMDSGLVTATWGADSPPSDGALKEKFRTLAQPSLAHERLERLEQTVWGLAEIGDAGALTAMLAPPAERRPSAQPAAERALPDIG